MRGVLGMDGIVRAVVDVVSCWGYDGVWTEMRLGVSIAVGACRIPASPGRLWSGVPYLVYLR